MKKYGYIINSDEADVLMENLQVLLDCNCDDLFIESDVLGRVTKTELAKLVSRLKPGDEVIIPNLGMFNEDINGIQFFSEKLVSHKARLRILNKKEDISYDTILPPQLDLVSQQVKRHYRPGTMGRPKINKNQIDEIIYYRVKERLTFREISELTNLSLGTVYKYIKDYQDATS